MKEKGFTLIELLSVIVILAIIALITTPIIINIISSSKEESNKRSVEMYAKSVKNAVVKYQLNNHGSIIGKFETKDGEKLTLSGEKGLNLIVEYEGNVVCKVIEIYEDGNIYLGKCKINKSEKEYTYGNRFLYDGQEVYFDVKKGIGCTREEYNFSYDETIKDYLNSQTGYNGIKEKNDMSDKNSCLKFYAFNDSINNKTISLLLDHNIIDTIRWSTDDYNTYGPNEKILLQNTEEWQGTIEPISYEIDQSTQSSKAKYTINYTGYKARLMEAQEIAEITGADRKDTLNWKEQTASVWFYLDGAKGIDSNWQTQVVNQTNKSDYYWLFDRTSNCIDYGCKIEDSLSQGYWTSSSLATYPLNAWIVSFYGRVNGKNVSSDSIGVRPVIEVLKSDLQ